MSIYIDTESFKKVYEKPPKKQFPMGMMVFKNPQGGGKTLSMIHTLIEVHRAFPEAWVIANLELKIPGLEYIRFNGIRGLQKALRFSNGEKGVIVVVDEWQLFCSKKEGVPPDVWACLCEQRKDRRLMLGTAQDWEDIDVSSRKKVRWVVSCQKIGRFQFNTVMDGRTIKWNKDEGGWDCKIEGYRIFKHNKELYDAYDTFYKIETNADFCSGVGGQRWMDSVKAVLEQQSGGRAGNRRLR